MLGRSLLLPPAVNALAFSPYGSLLATCEGAGELARIEVFQLSDGQLLNTIDASALARVNVGASSSRRSLTGDAPADLRDIQFSPDGRYLAWCGSGGVVVARVPVGQER